MNNPQANNPLHGVTLEMMLTRLVEHYGWEELGGLIDIRCFNVDPSISSSLKFLRKTDWARTKVEQLYLRLQKRIAQAAVREAAKTAPASTETAGGETPASPE